MSVIGERVKLLRKEQGLRREDLSSQAGISYDNLVRIEQGKIKDPRGSTLDAFARVLQVTVDFLLGRTDKRTLRAGRVAAGQTRKKAAA